MKKRVKHLALCLVVPSMLLLGGCGTSTSTTGDKSPESTNKTASSQPAASSGIKERTITAGIVLQEDHSEGKGLKKFAEVLAQKSGGKIKVQPHFAGQLGDDQKMIKALQAGTQDVTITSTSPLIGTVKEFGIFDLPFIFNNEKEGAAVADGPVGKKLIDKLPEHKLVGLAYWENGMRSLVNSKKPVAKLQDFQGLKIRTQQNEVHLEAFKTLGANPVPMPYTEVFSALESKTIDGAENALPVFETDKFYEVQKYLSLTEHVYSPLLLMVSKKLWDDLSPEEQKIFQEASLESREFQRETNRADVKKSMENLKKAGMQINEISQEDKKVLGEKAKPVIDGFAKKLGEDLVKEMYDEVNKARK